MKIIFMGSSDFAIPSLEYCFKEHNLLAIYTKQGKPANRGMHIRKTDSELFGEQNNIPVITPAKFTESEIEVLKAYSPDYIIVASYGLILPKRVLEIPKKLSINLHGSLLPELRGAAPIQYAILNDFKKTGVSIQVMGMEVDAGDILLQEEILLNGTETYRELLKELGACASIGLKTFLSDDEYFIKRRYVQNHSLATFANKINKDNYEICFDVDSAIMIERKIRAFPEKCWTIIGDIRVKILAVEVIQDNESFDDGLVFKCIHGKIKLNKIRPEGKREMSGEAFRRGHKIR